MEDLSGDMEKTVTPPGLPKPRKRHIGWTLLFVGDHGRIIRLKKFKGFMMAWAIGSTIILSAAVSLGFFYYDEASKNSLLEDSLRADRQKIRSLRDEKDILLARVVVAESKRSSKKGKTSKKPDAVKKKDITEETVLPAVKQPPVKKAAKPAPVMARAEAPENRTKIEIESTVSLENLESAKPAAPSAVITIDDFFFIVEPDSNRLRIKYKIRNADPNSNPVSGRTFLILKPKEHPQDNWTVLPVTELASGKPVNVKKGRSFSITRFKTIRFKAPYTNGLTPFETATILVYATSGELMLEKSFPIEDS